MVRLFRYQWVFLLALAACSKKTVVKPDPDAFDASLFRIDRYSDRVADFLRSRPETQELPDYQAVFVNTENCSACMRSAFENLGPFLRHTRTKTLVFINDSTLIRSIRQHPNIQFICLPVEVYREKNIFHSQMYLYSICGDRMKTTDLLIGQIDSLNRIN